MGAVRLVYVDASSALFYIWHGDERLSELDVVGVARCECQRRDRNESMCWDLMIARHLCGGALYRLGGRVQRLSWQRRVLQLPQPSSCVVDSPLSWCGSSACGRVRQLLAPLTLYWCCGQREVIVEWCDVMGTWAETYRQLVILGPAA